MAAKSPLDKGVPSSKSKSPDHRNIVIFGRTAVGKATLANEICGNPGLLNVRSPIEGMVCEPSCRVCVSHSADDVTYSIILIDTVARQRAIGPTALEALHARLKHPKVDPEMKILLIFVVRQGQETEEEREAFAHLIKSMDNSLFEGSVLIVTGCEALSDSARKRYKDSLRCNEITKDVTARVQDILFVGLPAIEDMDEDTKDLLKSKRQKDVAALQELCDNEKYRSDIAMMPQYCSLEKCDSNAVKDFQKTYSLKLPEPSYDRTHSNECCLS